MCGSQKKWIARLFTELQSYIIFQVLMQHCHRLLPLFFFFSADKSQIGLQEEEEMEWKKEEKNKSKGERKEREAAHEWKERHKTRMKDSL